MKPLIYQYRMQWRELLQCVGVVPDNISSLVHAFGIRLKKQEIWHPAYEAFCRCGEPYVLTMENLKGITEVQPVGTCVYIVENKMVFSYLMEQVQGKNVSLLCTSGQPRYAALKLISLIVPYRVGFPFTTVEILIRMGLELPTDSGSGSETESNSLECHQRITGTVFQKKYLERMAEKSWNTFGTRY